MTATRGRSAVRIARIATVIAPFLVLSGCATPPSDTGSRTGAPAARWSGSLDQAVEAQRARPDATAMKASLPASLERELSVRAIDASKAQLDLDAVLPIVAGEPGTTADRPDPDPRALRLYVSGKSRLADGKAADALADLEEAARLDPAAPEVWREVGEAQLALGRRASALASFGKAARLGLRDARVLSVLAREAIRSGRTEEAGRLLARALTDTHVPADLERVIDADLAECLQDLGYLRASREALERALTRAPGGITLSRYQSENAELHRRRGDLWRRAGDAAFRLGDYAGAERAYAQSASAGGTEIAADLMVAAMLRQGHSARAAMFVLDEFRREGGSLDDRRVALLGHIASQSEIGPTLTTALGALSADHAASAPSIRRGLAVAAASLAPPAEARRVLAGTLREFPTDPVLWRAFVGLLPARDFRDRADAVSEVLRTAPGGGESAAGQLLALGASIDETADYLLKERRPAARLLGSWLLHLLGEPARAMELAEGGSFPESLQPHADVVAGLAASERGDRARLDAIVDRAVRRLERDGSVEHRKVAVDLLAVAGRLDESLRMMSPLAENEGATPEILLTAASLSLRLADASRAEGYAQRARVIDRFDERAYQVLLGLYQTGGALANEAKFATTARELRQNEPGSRLIRLMSAQEMMARSLWPQAERMLLDLVEPIAESGDVLSMLAGVWERCAAADPEMNRRGEAWLRGRLEGREQSPGLAVALARVLVAQGRAAEADAMLVQRFSRWHIEDVARAREWVLREGLDRPDEADRLAMERLERSAGSIDAALELCELGARTGRLETGLNRLADALDAEAAGPSQAARVVRLLAGLDFEKFAEGATGEAAAALRVHDAAARRGVPMPPGMAIVRLYLIASGTADDPRRVVEAIEAVAREQPELREQAYIQVVQLLEARADPAAALRFLPAAAASIPREDRLRPLFLMEWVRFTVQRGGAEDARRLVESAGDPAELLGLIALNRTIPVETPEGDTEKRAEIAYQIATDMNGLERNAEAEAVYRLCLSLNPRHGWACNNLGYHLLEEGRDWDEAERLIAIAYEALPDDFHVIDSLGWVRYKRGKIEDHARDDGGVEPGAVTLLKAAVELAGIEDDGTIRDHYGDALWRAGKKEEAKRMWQRAAEAYGLKVDMLTPQARPGVPAGPDPEFLVVARRELEQARAKIGAASDGREPAISPLANE